jgi:hypothetical protein
MKTVSFMDIDETIMKIKARFSSHVIDLRKLEVVEIEQIKEALIHHNFDERFEIIFT